MTDTIQNLKEQYGANSPAVAAQLNSIGAELQCRGDSLTALKIHQEALTILEWNKCNALLYDFVEKSKEYAIEMAMTLRKIGNVLREMNDFVGAAGTLANHVVGIATSIFASLMHIYTCRSLQGMPRYISRRFDSGRWRSEKEAVRIGVQTRF